jgi:hypothetical protein
MGTDIATGYKSIYGGSFEGKFFVSRIGNMGN